MEKYIIRNIERPAEELVESFVNFDVTTVYEAQGKIGLLSNELRPVLTGTSICGPAVTVRCHAGDNLMIHAAIEVCKPGDVLVVTTIGDSFDGMVGELIVRALQKRGVKGLIIDAGIRDVDQIRQLGFPVWSKSISSKGTTKNRGGWVNSDVISGDTVINPGDIILADDDGVVSVKRQYIEKVLQLTKQRIENEKVTKERIENGELSLDFYNLREVLKRENVKYYDSVEELLGNKKGG